VPFAAGGGNDTVARLIQRDLEKALGEPLVIENKPAGSGSRHRASRQGSAAPPRPRARAFNGAGEAEAEAEEEVAEVTHKKKEYWATQNRTAPWQEACISILLLDLPMAIDTVSQ
jgi:hypothetical protein